MNRFVRLGALGLGLLAFGGAAALAEEGRYVMERIEGGVVRLDTETGEMSLCRQQGEQLVCRMAADEKLALEEEIAALERELEAHGRLPTDNEIDRAMGIMEDMMRRFLDVIEEFEDRIGDGSGTERERT